MCNSVCTYFKWVRFSIVTPIFRSPPRVSLVSWFLFSSLRFSLFPFRKSARLQDNTHNAILHPQCNILCLAAVYKSVNVTSEQVHFVLQLLHGWTTSGNYIWIRSTTGEELLRNQVLVRTSNAEGWRWPEQVLTDVTFLRTIHCHSVPKGHRPSSERNALQHLWSRYDVVRRFQYIWSISLVMSKEGCWGQVQSVYLHQSTVLVPAE